MGEHLYLYTCLASSSSCHKTSVFQNRWSILVPKLTGHTGTKQVMFQKCSNCVADENAGLRVVDRVKMSKKSATSEHAASKYQHNSPSVHSWNSIIFHTPSRSPSPTLYNKYGITTSWLQQVQQNFRNTCYHHKQWLFLVHLHHCLERCWQ